jgi:hypothetical protein
MRVFHGLISSAFQWYESIKSDMISASLICIPIRISGTAGVRGKFRQALCSFSCHCCGVGQSGRRQSGDLLLDLVERYVEGEAKK